MKLQSNTQIVAKNVKPKPRSDWLLARILDWRRGAKWSSEAMSYLIAEVVALGPGRPTPKGCFDPPKVKIGDTILVEENRGCRTPIKGKEHLLLSQEEAIPMNGIGLLADVEA